LDRFGYEWYYEFNTRLVDGDITLSLDLDRIQLGAKTALYQSALAPEYSIFTIDIHLILVSLSISLCSHGTADAEEAALGF
jgi:hypothetical protein